MRMLSFGGLALALLFASAVRGEESPYFVDVAAERGLPAGFAHRNLFRDVDGDGWVDALLHNERLFLNRPAAAGGRRFVAQPSVRADARRPDLVLLGDFDHDGDADAYLGLRGDPGNPKWSDDGARSRVALWEGEGFRQLPAPADAPAETLICGALLDYDRDGRLDLVLGSTYVSGGLPLEAYPLRLLRGLPGGAFRETTAAAGLSLRRQPGAPDSRRPVYGLSTADVDGDGWTDILVCAYGRQRNLLYRNLGDGTFAELGQASGFAGDADRSGVYPADIKEHFRVKRGIELTDEEPFRANGNSFDVACGDADNDGDLDLFLSEITHAWAGPSSDRSSFLENLGGPGLRFRRDAAAMPRVHDVPNWNQGDLYAGWLDVDNDGRLDLLLASGDYPDGQYLRLFRQQPDGRFRDETARAGLRWENSTQLSFADYDRDGDVDVLIGNSNMRLPKERRLELRPALFENRIGSQNHWLNVRLQGRGPEQGGANRAGIGARITVWVGDWQATREIQGGSGHAGHADAYEAAFGLGRRTRVDRLEVRWPNAAGSVSVFEDLEVDRFLLIREGASTPETLGPF